MRWVRTLVLPEPAPATTSSGPSVWVTASRCTGLRPCRRSEGTEPGITPTLPACSDGEWTLRGHRSGASMNPTGTRRWKNAVSNTTGPAHRQADEKATIDRTISSTAHPLRRRLPADVQLPDPAPPGGGGGFGRSHPQGEP